MTFETLYDECFEVVWRNLRRMGVPEATLDDAVQDTFLVAHRRLGEFEGRSSPRTWMVGIALKVAADHRRRQRRKGNAEEIPATLVDSRPGPHEASENREAMRILDGVLQQLDEARREVFVLAELEQMTAPEISQALDLNVNTVYSRLRAARADFDQALARHKRGER